MQADLAEKEPRNPAFPVFLNGFFLAICELVLVTKLVNERMHQHSIWNYALPLLLAGPFVVGVALKRRLTRMRATGEVSSTAFQTIDRDSSGLVTITYLVLMIFGN